jgi:hypothetical protein
MKLDELLLEKLTAPHVVNDEDEEEDENYYDD